MGTARRMYKTAQGNVEAVQRSEEEAEVFRDELEAGKLVLRGPRELSWI
jgi:hypothetical protein